MITRCASKGGRYRVTFTELGKNDDGDVVPMGSMQIQMYQHAWNDTTHEGSPILSTEEPYEGDLCGCELHWLKGFPGKDFNYHWRFEITALSKGRSRKGN